MNINNDLIMKKIIIYFITSVIAYILSIIFGSLDYVNLSIIFIGIFLFGIGKFILLALKENNSMKKRKFNGYTISEDYRLLWKLIHEGYRVPGWILFSEEYKIYDLVEIKMSPDKKRYMIGTRGMGYEGIIQKELNFSAICEKLELIFIVPKDSN